MSLYRQYGYKKVSPSTYGYSEAIARQQRRRMIFWSVVLLVFALIGGFLILPAIIVMGGIN